MRVTGSSFALLALSSDGFRRLAAGDPPEPGLTLPDPPLAPAEILSLLAGLADRLRADIDPNAWLVLDGSRIVALCSVTSISEAGVPMIGYGTAPGEEGRGAATAAVAGVLAWARDDARVQAIGAETGTGNIGSQRVLERNGFRITGERIDDDDGPVLCWRWSKD